MKSVTVTLALTLVALAGCFGGDDDPSPTPTGSSSTSPSPTGGPDPTDNTAPTLTLTADVTSGVAPLNVSFTLAVDDFDGDNLTYALDADGDGTADFTATLSGADFSYPDQVLNFTFAAGNFTAMATVTDGIATANATLGIVVAAPAAPVSQDAEGGWDVGLVGCPHDIIGVFDRAGITYEQLAGGNGLFWVSFEIDAATRGMPFVFSGTFANPPANPPDDTIMEIDFFDEAGAYITYANDVPDVDVMGTVPSDATSAIVIPCGAGPGTFTYHAGNT